jgi:hypothetical protein
MMGKGVTKAPAAANKSIKERRMDFELNQQAAAALRNKNNMEGGFDRAF